MKKELSALKPLFILLPLLVLGFVLFWTLFGGTLSKDFQFKSAPSEQFTQEEIQGAADVVLRRFKYDFSGCTMTKLQYVDAYASSDTWNWAAEYNADEGVVFHSTFTTDDFFAPKMALTLMILMITNGTLLALMEDTGKLSIWDKDNPLVSTNPLPRSCAEGGSLFFASPFFEHFFLPPLSFCLSPALYYAESAFYFDQKGGTPMDADFRLLSQMKRGEEEAIECFVRKYYPSILQYCHYHLQEIHDAEDLTQETFARFFASLDRYKHYGKAANYLYVIAGNLCRDHYRRQSELPLADLPEPADRPLDTLDTRLDLQDAFRVLPPEIQPAAVLFFLQERKQREIAKILGIGLPLVKYRIRKARELLAQFLRKEAH